MGLHEYANDVGKSHIWTLEDILKVKETFVDNCGKPNRTNSEVVIRFKEGSGGLVPSESATFDEWFLKSEDKDKELSVVMAGV